MATTQQQPERLLTKRQFAAKLAHTERTVDRHQVQGIYPAGIKVVIGGSVRFRESIADQWIADGCPVPSMPEQQLTCSVGECNRPAELYEHDGGIFAYCPFHAVGTRVPDPERKHEKQRGSDED